MILLAAIAGLLFPAVTQALTGRRRAALLILGALLAWAVLAFLAPGASLLLFALPLASAVDAARAHRRGARPEKRSIAIAWVVFVALVAETQLLKRYLFTAYKIPSTSMAPTLAIGDLVFAERLTLSWSPPSRGDLVVFQGTAPSYPVRLGRIVAVGGDHIAIVNHVPTINGQRAPQVPVGLASYGEFNEPSIGVSHATETLGGHRYGVFTNPQIDPSVGDFPNRDRGCNPVRMDPSSPASGPTMMPAPDGVSCVVPPGTFFFLGDNRWNSNDSRYQGVVPIEKVLGRVRGIWYPGLPSLGGRWSRLGRLD